MAYTTDRTWVTGEVVTAALMNTYVRDNFKWLSTDKPMTRCRNTTNLTIPNGSVTALTYNSERFDNANLHSTSTNTSRITISTANAGKYILGAHVEWVGNPAGDYRSFFLRFSGATVIAAHLHTPSPVFGIANQSVVTMYSLSNDYFESCVQQDSGGNLDVAASGNYSPEFWAIWVGV